MPKRPCIRRSWRHLPHFSVARNEAYVIMAQLWQDEVYGPSRHTNSKGRAKQRFCERFCDRFYNFDHAVLEAAKLILRDKYDEVPVGATARDLDLMSNKRLLTRRLWHTLRVVAYDD